MKLVVMRKLLKCNGEFEFYIAKLRQNGIIAATSFGLFCQPVWWCTRNFPFYQLLQ